MAGLEILQVVAEANRYDLRELFDLVDGTTREGVPVDLWRALR